ncbi:hypothetical protein AB0I27_22745 [Streptomyces sp. NPDC050597]|uniref:hypothetical protein n=1 Tax=Streptomyces sp. NPDC050597 TaxID=3157212 RepID=UPI003420F41A
MRYILWSLLAAYLLLVGLWPAAAAPIDLAASGAFVVLAKPPVLLLAALVATVLHYRRRPTPARAGGH